MDRVRRALVRVVRYLGPLLRDALVCLWRLAIDLFNSARWSFQWWQTRRHPERADTFLAWRVAQRERRAARWSSFRTLPLSRRFAIAFASFVLVVSAGWLVQSRWPTARGPTAAASPEGRPPTSVTTSSSAFDVSSAAARMRSEISRATAGQWVFLRDGPVLAPGPSPAFDGFHVSNPAVLREDDTHYHVWYRGCRLHGLMHDCAIGHATSPDGLVWRPDREPALVPAEGADEFHLGGIAVARVNSKYFLWYSVEANSFANRPSSPLFLATSTDGTRWQQHGRVLTATEQLPRFIEPTVVHDGTQFHLWFADSLTVFDGVERKQPADGPFLRHLTSPDGKTWKDSSQFPLGPLDRGRIRVTMTRTNDGSYRAFYFGRMPKTNAAAIGWLVSADGNDWQVESTVPVNVKALGDDVREVPYATGLREALGLHMWFVTQRSGGRQELRAAFYKEQG